MLELDFVVLKQGFVVSESGFVTPESCFVASEATIPLQEPFNLALEQKIWQLQKVSNRTLAPSP